MNYEHINLKPTVLITTKDRCGLLRRAINSVIMQDVDVELIVVDDGSSDETSAMVRAEFPQAKLIRNEKPLGIIRARNQAAALIRSEILFTLDDDAVYTEPNIISRVLKQFDHPRVGAVAIPHIDIADGRSLRVNFVDWASNANFPCIATYHGGVNAKRIEVFRKIGGYRGQGRQGEETTYCIRMLAHGYLVRIADCPPIHHFPQRTLSAQEEIAKSLARNSIIFAWQHVPIEYLLIHLAGIIFNQIRIGISDRKTKAVLIGLKQGIVAMASTRRDPVPFIVYKLHRRLVKSGPLPLSEVERKIEEFCEIKK